jgi:glutaredoxin-related protein
MNPGDLVKVRESLRQYETWGEFPYAFIVEVYLGSGNKKDLIRVHRTTGEERLLLVEDVEVISENRRHNS